MKPTLLVVEDDPDALEMLMEWLSMEGYRPIGASTVDEALGILRGPEHAIELVLTDFMLPDRDGLDLIRTASKEGLVDVQHVILLSGAPPTREAAALGVRTVKKPIDLVALVTEIERMLHRRLDPMPTSKKTPPIRLVLYVSGDSPASLRALRTLKKRIAAVAPDAVLLEVRDVAQHHEAALEHRIAFTPTLVRIAPAPMIRLIGDLRDESALEDILPQG